MPLTAGERLGPYEVLALIGAGGMSEVWKARDTRLARDLLNRHTTNLITGRPGTPSGASVVDSPSARCHAIHHISAAEQKSRLYAEKHTGQET